MDKKLKAVKYMTGIFQPELIPIFRQSVYRWLSHKPGYHNFLPGPQ